MVIFFCPDIWIHKNSINVLIIDYFLPGKFKRNQHSYKRKYKKQQQDRNTKVENKECFFPEKV